MKHPRQFAIVIGIDTYQGGIPPLETAVNDARAIATLLAEQYHYKVVCILDKNATYRAINRRLNQLKSGILTFKKQEIRLHKDDQLLFYFAGHGLARDSLEMGDEARPAGFVLPQDAYINPSGPSDYPQGKDNSGNFIPMQLIHDALVDIPCRHLLLILDCCFAGTFRWAGTTRSIRRSQRIYKERYRRFRKGTAREVITSAAHDEKALDSVIPLGHRFQSPTGDRHSPFAERLLTVLGGREKVYQDLYADGIITANELFVYLNNTLADLTDKQQPGFCQLRGHDKGEYLFLLPGFDEKKLQPAPRLSKATNPWMGLRSYDAKDKDLFFGRDHALSELNQSVEQSIFTPVVGISGSGKSSLVKAGLIPKLIEDNYQIIGPCRPGERSLKSLEISIFQCLDTLGTKVIAELKREKLLPLPRQWSIDAEVFWRWLQAIAHRTNTIFPGKINRWLLVFDQFEELVTLDSDGEAKILMKWLSDLIQLIRGTSDNSVLKIVVTLRADFEGQFQEDIISRQEWMRSRYGVPLLSMEDIREIVTKPAADKVLHFDPPELVDRLVADVLQMPGALPLLSFVLSELYLDYLETVKTEGRSDRTLTLSAYEKLGGVTGSLTQRAESVYNSFDLPEQQTVRRVMTRMVVPGEELARRRVTRAELTYKAPTHESVQRCLDCFVKEGLLVTGKTDSGEEYFEPAHDALVRSWERLLGWMREDQANLLLQRRLTPAALEWQAQTDTSQWWDRGLDKGVRGIEKATSYLSRAWQQQILRFVLRKKSDKKKQSKRDFLWTTEPRLDVLGDLLKTQRLWFNAAESDFVEDSLFQRRRNVTLRWAIAGIVFSVVTVIGAIAGVSLFLANRQRVDQYLDIANNSTKNFDDKNALISALAAMEVHRYVDFLPDSELQDKKYKTFRVIDDQIKTHRFFTYPYSNNSTGQVVPHPDGGFWLGGEGQLIKLTPEGKEERSPIPLKDEHGHSISIEKLIISSRSGRMAISDNQGQVWLLSKEGYITDINGAENKSPIANDNKTNSSHIVFGPDDILATVGDGKILRWWSLNSHEIREQKVDIAGLLPNSVISSLAVSENSDSIWIGTGDGKIGQWNIEKAECIRLVPAVHLGFIGPIRSLFTDNKRVVLGTEYGIRIIPHELLSSRTCEPLYVREEDVDEFRQDVGQYFYLDLNVSGPTLKLEEGGTYGDVFAVSDTDKTIHLFRVQEGEKISPEKSLTLIRTIPTHHKTTVSSISSVIRDQKTILVSAGQDGIVQQFNITELINKSLKPENVGYVLLQGNVPVTSITRLTENLIFEGAFVGYKDGAILQLDKDGNFISKSRREHQDEVTHLKHYKDHYFNKEFIISGDSQGAVWRWELVGRGYRLREPSSPVISLDVDGFNQGISSQIVLSAHVNGEIVVYSGTRPQSWSYFDDDSSTNRLVWAGIVSESTILGIDNGGGWRIWDFEGKPKKPGQGQLPDANPITTVSRKENNLVIGHRSGYWKSFTFDAGKMKFLGDGKVKSGAVQLVDYRVHTDRETGDNVHLIVTSDEDNNIQVWSEDGEDQWSVNGDPHHKITALHLISRKVVISAHEDGSVVLWNEGKVRDLQELTRRSCEVVRNSHIDSDSDATIKIDLNAFREAKSFCDR